MKCEIIDIDEIEEIIIAYANGDFSKRLDISEKKDERDTISFGINMLGEELEKTTISRDYFANIYNSVSEMLFFVDQEGKIVDVNLRTEKVLGKNLNEITSINIKNLIKNHSNYVCEIIQSSGSSKEQSVSFDDFLIITEGNEIPVSCSFSKVIDRMKKHKGYLFIARDISDRIEKEKNDLKLIINTQEKERKRLANDIHDSLGQELNALKMYINSLAVMDRQSPEYSSAVNTCKVILDSSVETIRNISFDLMPKALEEGGLLSAVEELVNRLSVVSQIEYNFPDFKTVLKKDSQINTYRIIQEFINNSLKHSPKSLIKLHIAIKNRNISVSLKDDGVGFTMEDKKLGNGIFNIKNRLKTLNAIYTYTSEVNKGTELEFVIKKS